MKYMVEIQKRQEKKRLKMVILWNGQKNELKMRSELETERKKDLKRYMNDNKQYCAFVEV